MSRERREQEEDSVARLFADLEREISTPPDQDLRALARNASSRSRPLPPPASSRRWPLQAGWTGVLVLAVVVAIGLGVGLGALIAPSGTAASGPLGTGFLPESGWTVLQSGADATPERQALAVASNVQLHPEDDARGIRNSSGLPFETLLRLPRGGVVIVALFSLREPYAWYDEEYPRRDLPLRVNDAARSNFYSVPVRPDRPLGQYQLQATVNDHYLNIYFYFGTLTPSPALIAAAQEQLDRLVVGPLTVSDVRPARANTTADPSASRMIDRTQSMASNVVDRTVVCATGDGIVRELDVSATSGVRLRNDRSKWQVRPNASFVADATFIPDTGNTVSATVSAGWPPVKHAGSPVSHESLWVSTRCRSSRARVPLSTAGLSGADASQFKDEYDCVVPARVLVRIRSVFRAPTSVRRVRQRYGFGKFFEEDFVARGPVREATLAIRTVSGKPIALGTAHESGRARIFVGETCGPNG